VQSLKQYVEFCPQRNEAFFAVEGDGDGQRSMGYADTIKEIKSDDSPLCWALFTPT
jgi:hypothetical protein